MKKRAIVTLALALGLTALNTVAQDAGGQPPRGDRPPPPDGGPGGGPQDGARPNGPGRGGFRPPISPLEEALDANHDGIISAEEIANASAALKKLDKNGDGQLTPDEFRPMRRGPGGPPPGGPGGQGGAGPGFDQGAGGPPNGDGQNRPPRRPAGE